MISNNNALWVFYYVKIKCEMEIKMTQKFFLLMALFGLFAARALFALPLESLVTEAQAKQLLQSGAVDREVFDSSSPFMIPNYEELKKLLETNRQSINPNITVESLRLYTKPPSRADWTGSERTELYNGITAVSTLKGLEYFSKSRNKMRLLYETSAVIDGPDTKNPRPDPVFAVPPAELSMYVRQKDLTFGDNIYKFAYYARESCFIVFLENETNLRYGPITVVDKGRLCSVIAVFDCGRYLLVYSASLARASMLPGMKNRAGESISNRANALLFWFTQKADKVFGKT